MLAKRIIPCLDVFNGRVVKGVEFKNLKDIGDPVQSGRYYSDVGADELVFYDIGATNEARGITIRMVEKIAAEVKIPFMVGGGIRTLEDFYLVLGAGADKVSVNSAGLKTPELITQGAKRFGNQCVVLSMDAKKESDGSWRVYTHGGRKPTGIDALLWAKQGENLGAGEIVVNAIHADGVKKGYDIELTRKIADCVKIPVIASGGAGNVEDFYKVLTDGRADGALAASVFHKREIEINELKVSLRKSGVIVRAGGKNERIF